jgi:hypothetical protein
MHERTLSRHIEFDITISQEARMADILIRNVSPRTKERLRLQAKRLGKSLEADLRETLEISDLRGLGIDLIDPWSHAASSPS